MEANGPGYGPGGSQLLVRVSLPEGEPEVPGGAVPVPGLGDQVRDHATFGLTPAATVVMEWTEEAGPFPVGGSPYVAERFTDEHRAALDWLDEITDDTCHDRVFRPRVRGLDASTWDGSTR
ncbi:hypothetical protein L6R50_24520 [Myxococcota bacterium]|nr:hypothetical protein [Myxococcota bacterium]